MEGLVYTISEGECQHMGTTGWSALSQFLGSLLSRSFWNLNDKRHLETASTDLPRINWCLTNVMTFYDEETGSANEGEGMDVAYFDFSKACGMISHGILLQVGETWTGKVDYELFGKKISDQLVSKGLSMASSPFSG